MRDLSLIRDLPEDDPQSQQIDALLPTRLIVGTSYRGQYFVVEETGALMRVIAGPFDCKQDAAESVLLLLGRSLRSAS